MSEVQVVVESEVFPVSGRSVIGRSSDSDIQLDDQRVSRTHAVLDVADGKWVLTDQSSGGMWLDGRRVSQVVVDRALNLRLGGEGAPTITVRPAVTVAAAETIGFSPSVAAAAVAAAPAFTPVPPSAQVGVAASHNALTPPASSGGRGPLIAIAAVVGVLAVGLVGVLAFRGGSDGEIAAETDSSTSVTSGTTETSAPPETSVTTAPAATDGPSPTRAPEPTTTAPPTTAPPSTAPPSTQMEVTAPPNMPENPGATQLAQAIKDRLIELDNPYGAIAVDQIPVVGQAVCDFLLADMPVTDEEIGVSIQIIHTALDFDGAELRDTGELVALSVVGYCPDALNL